MDTDLVAVKHAAAYSCRSAMLVDIDLRSELDRSPDMVLHSGG